MFINEFEFYHRASVGGNDSLRYYRNKRSDEDKSFYQNTDICFNLRNFKTKFIPIQVGVFGCFE
ncbi:hypothetical protein [Lutibacter sp.]|uniref:hypothetical protein n=1 Tax=Lutibacter sp. TaxID=1925666 RepID=UPI002734FC27|nr:hypothetical protein [Lutibacter sp.]